jgi:ubiquinone/menaquinone biosynthesis C-methylase UbiE
LSPCDERGGAILVEGTLHCPRCKINFPVKHGIVHFISSEELDKLSRRFARFYDLLSGVYPLFAKAALMPFGGERKARKEVLDRLELNGGSVLEVSVGTGVNLPYLFESPGVGDVYGLDISLGELERCRGFARSRGWSVDLFFGTAEALPFKEDSFDTVLHIGGINFFSDRKRAIDEMIRVARPGTRIVIADENENLARLLGRAPGISGPEKGDEKADAPIHLVPNTMLETEVRGVWKAHGHYHGYCLEFRKPG